MIFGASLLSLNKDFNRYDVEPGAPSLTFLLSERRFYLVKRSRHGWDDGTLNRLLVDLEVGVMMVVVMMAVYYHHDLRLRRIGYCDAEGEHESEQNLFHNLVCRLANPFTELL
jgi:hypothetical protein